MIRILEVRHCDSYMNINAANSKSFKNDRKVTLTHWGKKKALITGEKLDGILAALNLTAPVVVECSPYVRTKQTRDGTLSKVKAHPFIVMPENELLIERVHTEAWGLTPQQREARWPLPKDQWYTAKYPGSESFEEIAMRGAQFMASCKERYGNDVTLIVFGHGHQLRGLNMSLLGKTPTWYESEFEPANGSIKLIEGSEWESLEDKGYLHNGQMEHPRVSSRHSSGNKAR